MTISFRNDTGEVKTLDFGYYEGGYTGTVEASVGTDIKIIKEKTDVSFRLYLGFFDREINIFPPYPD